MNITIVGAGISGLSAAFELQKSGFEVTLLEGSERLGGKILTSEIEGFNIDDVTTTSSTSLDVESAGSSEYMCVLIKLIAMSA